jgi:hypothetical protein
MSDEANNPIPADPPETQPPTGTGGTSTESGADTIEITQAADVPETQPPKS